MLDVKEDKKVEFLLKEFASVLDVILPSSVHRSFFYRPDGRKQFLIELVGTVNNAGDLSPALFADLALLFDGLIGAKDLRRVSKAMEHMVLKFDVTDIFLNQLTRNLESWGMIHPFLALKSSWFSSARVMKRVALTEVSAFPSFN